MTSTMIAAQVSQFSTFGSHLLHDGTPIGAGQEDRRQTFVPFPVQTCFVRVAMTAGISMRRFDSSQVQTRFSTVLYTAGMTSVRVLAGVTQTCLQRVSK